MKKLVMIAAIVACVASVRAASVDWSFSEQVRTDKTFTDLTGYSAYLFTATAWDAVTAQVSGGALDSSAITGYAGSAAIQVATAATARTFSTGSSVITTTSASLSGSSYYIVLANLDAGGDVWAKSITADVYDETADPIPTHTAGSWKITKTATGSFLSNGNAAFTANVPEPTSGLMLLLGIAGLALKRKRA